MVSWQTHALELYLRINTLLSGKSEEFDVPKERAGVESMASLFKPFGEIACEPVLVNGIPAEWIIPKDEVAGRAILFLHGGSFITGSITSHRTLAGNVALACRARVLLLDYRLAPEHPFPAAIMDTASAYAWLLSEGYQADQILVAGDSAGGTLTLNLLIKLRDEQRALPAGGVCFSPAPDLSFSGETWVTNAKKDLMLIERKERQAMQLYLRDVDPRSPEASPSYAELGGLPPLLIQIGSYEVLLAEVEGLAEKAKAAGVDVTLEVWEGMQHEWQFSAKFLPEGKRAIRRVGEWVERLLGDRP